MMPKPIHIHRLALNRARVLCGRSVEDVKSTARDDETTCKICHDRIRDGKVAKAYN